MEIKSGDFFSYSSDYKKLKRLESKANKRTRRLTPDQYAEKIIKWLEEHSEYKKYE